MAWNNSITAGVPPLTAAPCARNRTFRRGPCPPIRRSLLSMGSVVEMNGVVKRFGAVTALDGLDFEVAAGEVHGFLGPNGSGKSTTLRLLLGL